MKRLSEYITESAFATDAWQHRGAYDYAAAVLDKILDDEPLRMGNDGKGGEIEADAFDKNKVRELRKNLTGTTYKDFDACLKDKGAVWTKLYKGDFSGYNGEYSKNKGNAFEQHFIEDYYTRYQKELADAMNIPFDDLSGEVTADGSNNTKRTLTLSDGNIYAFPKDATGYSALNKFDIGMAVTDVTVHTENGPVYLSLKYGDTLAFLNAGVNSVRVFPKDAFVNQDKNMIGDIGKAILKMLSIDEDLFIGAFADYKGDNKSKKRDKIVKDVTDSVNKSMLLEMLRSAIGYGFILVHQDSKGHTEYFDLRTRKALDSFLGDNIKSATIEYPVDGSMKRVNAVIDMDNISFVFNIRAKDGGVYPTHLMVDYKIKKK